jgi:hypothetical protein
MKTLSPEDNAELINKYFTTLTTEEKDDYLCAMNILD